jgi:hypothetical protein
MSGDAEAAAPRLLVHPGRMARKGHHFKGELAAPACATLASELGILAIEALSWDVHARPWRKDGLELTGTVSGRAVQACIVTLEPVAEAISEAIDLRFLPAEKAGTLRRPAQSEVDALDIQFDASPDEEPDTFSGDTLDAWAAVAEHFALGLNPYPRKPGAEFSAVADDGPEGALARALRQWKGGSAGE